MTNRTRVLAAIALALIFATGVCAQTIDTTRIERVVEKPLLDSSDMQVIDGFLEESTKAIIMTRDPSYVVRARTTILQYRSSKQPSAQRQYATQFSQSARGHIANALEQVSKLLREDQKFLATLNLLILVDNLEDAQLSDIAISMLKHRNAAVKYWAVHCLTNRAITEQFNEPANADLARRVVQELRAVVDDSSPEGLALMADFGAFLSIPEGTELLMEIADLRLKRYENWTVEYPLVDADILKALCGRIGSAKRSKSELARRFAQLYSYAIQLYAKEAGASRLTGDERQQLLSVLVETEEKCVRALLDAPQAGIRKAVEQDNFATLLAEHDRLLGSEAGTGSLPEKLGFNYGENPDGEARTAPLALPSMPGADQPE
jgi:hypothetical protein